MSPPGEGSTDPNSGVLRAVGSLLVALSGGDEAAAQRVLQNMQQRVESPDPGFGAPRSYDPLPPLPRAASQEVEFVLSDARQRAQRILDESMDRARDLMRREQRYEAQRYEPATPAIDPAAFDDLRRAIHGLVTEVRDIQQRLARIESLLTAGRNPEPEPPRVQEPEARYEPPRREGPRYAAPAYEPPQQQPPPQREQPPPERYEPPGREPERQAPAWYEPPSPAPSPPPADAPPGRRRGERDWVPPHAHGDAPGSAVPPSREAAWQHQRDPYGEPHDDRAPAGAQASIVTFLPEDGGVLLRVTPLAGFQGLMRVQDALTRMDAVRHAAVEAYSQGEARLRLELEEPTDSEELAAGLAGALKEPVYVREASETDRELLIALR